MKKIISALLICLLIVCGCGKKEPTNEINTKTEVKTEGFYLNYNGHKFELNKVFNTNNYGQYDNMFENDNCAFGERDITYFYKDVEVETYGGKEGDLTVYSIRITSEEGKTNEGIGLYDSIEDAIKVYGANYKQNDNKYEYVKGNTSLIFITENDLIISIEYRVNNIG